MIARRTMPRLLASRRPRGVAPKAESGQGLLGARVSFLAGLARSDPRALRELVLVCSKRGQYASHQRAAMRIRIRPVRLNRFVAMDATGGRAAHGARGREQLEEQPQRGHGFGARA